MTERTHQMGRRRLLATAGVSSAALLAGCFSSPSTDSNGEENPNGNEGASTTQETLNEDLPYTAPPEIIDLGEQGNEVTLRTEPARHELVEAEADGGPIELPEVWAWQADDHAPSVPGPILRAQEGEELEIHYENSNDVRPHTFHVHALEKGWEDDGAPAGSGHSVNPGESHTYNITATPPGTQLYHCHFQTHNHLDMGMYGIFRVDPADYNRPDREFFLTVKDWDTDLSTMMAGGDVEYSHRDRNPDAFTINGRSGPSTFHPETGSPLVVEEGDRVRVHLTNNGYEAHPIHVHNHRFQVVEKDGSPVPEAARYDEDVTHIAPAERKTIEFTADAEPGIYLLHCHKVHHVMNEDSYPGGMVTAIVYEDAMDSEHFGTVMEQAGFDPEA